MNRFGWFAGGAVAVAGVGTLFVLPMLMSSAAMFSATEYKAGTGITPVSCGDTVTIQQVARNTPKVAGWSSAQVKNASTIVSVGVDLKMPPRSWVIAVATAMQESQLTNLGNLGKRNDHDSLGLFQQRPSSGWGTPAQIMDPIYASTKFYNKLKTIKGWQEMPLTKAAQRVQISGYPNAYAKWEDDAAKLVDAVSGGAAQAPASASQVGACAAHTDQVASSGWVRPVSAPIGDGWHTRGGEHQGVDLIAKRGTPIKAAAAGTVIHMECDRAENGYDCNKDGSPRKDDPGGCGWYLDIRHAGGIITRYCHMLRRPLVAEGDDVDAGQQIGVVGTSGHSSGPHLHFEVHRGSREAASSIDPVKFMQQHGAPLGTSEKGGERAD